MNEENLSSNECLLRVRAQVMTRDDSTGGWVPVGGGGLSNISLRKITRFVTDVQPPMTQPVKTRMEFLIVGNKTADDSICLNCVIKRNIQYNEVTPTFRHWEVNCKKFGLTFQNPADAKLFDAAIRTVIDELKSCSPEVSPKSGRGCASEVTSDADSGSVNDEDCHRVGRRGKRSSPNQQPASLPLSVYRSGSPQPSALSVPSPYSHRSSSQLLPVKRLASLPGAMTKSFSSPLDTGRSPQTTPTDPVRLSSSTHTVETTVKELSEPLIEQSTVSSTEKYTYVDVIPGNKDKCRPDPPSGPHEYSYPSMESSYSYSGKRDSISSIKVHNLDLMASHRPPLLPIKHRKKSRRKEKKGKTYPRGERMRCKYCHEYFCADANERGSCEFAPDKVFDGIKKVTCVEPALTSVLYRCDTDGECTNPCSCDKSVGCFGRWMLMGILSLLLPCLCCYLPLRGCHKVLTRCGVCGARHEPMDPR